MAICLKQLDSCGALFVPSAKTCNKELILGSEGIGIEIRHAFIKDYAIYDPGDILTIMGLKIK